MCEGEGPRGTPRDDGLTLVELLVALFIVMLAFAALASTVIASFSAIRSNESRVVATALGNELIEEMSTMPWQLLGSYKGDLADLAGQEDVLADGLDLQEGEFEGEVLVEISDAHPAIPEPLDVIPRDGREYQVERYVTWHVDAGANVKRMIVIITWGTDGSERALRTEGLRSPDPDDLLELEIRSFEVVGGDSGENKVLLRPPNYQTAEDTTANEYRNRDPFSAWVVVGDRDASVTLEFVPRDGDSNNPIELTSPSGTGEFEREFTIAQHEYEFPHGPVTFTATAESTDGVFLASNTTTVRFYQPLAIHEVTVWQWTDGAYDDVTASGIEVDDGCVPAGEVRIEATVLGMTVNEAAKEGALLVEWNEPNDEVQAELPLAMDGVAEDSEDFLEGGFYFAVVPEATEFTGPQFFTVSADRQVAGFGEPYTATDAESITVDIVGDTVDNGECAPS